MNRREMLALANDNNPRRVRRAYKRIKKKIKLAALSGLYKCSVDVNVAYSNAIETKLKKKNFDVNPKLAGYVGHTLDFIELEISWGKKLK